MFQTCTTALYGFECWPSTKDGNKNTGHGYKKFTLAFRCISLNHVGSYADLIQNDGLWRPLEKRPRR